VSRFRADAVLLDVDSDPTSYELLDRVRGHRAPSFVVLSEKATRVDVLIAIQRGAKHYILKPFEQERLIRGIEYATGQRDSP